MRAVGMRKFTSVPPSEWRRTRDLDPMALDRSPIPTKPQCPSRLFLRSMAAGKPLPLSRAIREKRTSCSGYQHLYGKLPRMEWLTRRVVVAPRRLQANPCAGLRMMFLLG
jgi:hypothetical protein